MMLLALSSACTPTSEDVGGAQQAVAGAATFHEVFRGAEATAQFRDQTTAVTIDLFTNRSTAFPGNDDAFIFYQYGVADLTSYVCSGYCYYARWTYDIGYGHLPLNDAHIESHSAQLHSSTTVDGFTNQRCVFDQRDYSYICTDGIPGALDVTWNADGMTTFFASGANKQTTGAWTTMSEGTWWSTSAQAGGTLGANSFATAYGTLNDTQSNQLMKTFTRE